MARGAPRFGALPTRSGGGLRGRDDVLIAQTDDDTTSNAANSVLAAVWLGLGSSFIVVGIALGLAGWIVPRVELVAAGAKTRWERSKAAVVAALVLPVISALIALVMTDVL